MIHLRNAILLFFLLYHIAQAVVVENSNLRLAGPDLYDGSFGGNHLATIYQDVAGTDPTSVSLSFVNGFIGITNTNVDQGSDWYFVQPGDQFGPAAIAANQFLPVPLLYTVPPQSPYYVGGAFDFYLGVSTSEVATIPFERHIFGWVEIHNDHGILTGVHTAVSYNPPGSSPGIIVDTLMEVPVPEPSSLMLGILGAIAVFVKRRKWITP